jgi:SNF2 family DNA or RNA helicase
LLLSDSIKWPGLMLDNFWCATSTPSTNVLGFYVCIFNFIMQSALSETSTTRQIFFFFIRAGAVF